MIVHRYMPSKVLKVLGSEVSENLCDEQLYVDWLVVVTRRRELTESIQDVFICSCSGSSVGPVKAVQILEKLALAFWCRGSDGNVTLS